MHAIARAALDFPQGRRWNKIFAKYEILSQMTGARWSICSDGVGEKKGPSPQQELRDESLDAAAYLSDFVQKNSGKKIWGFNFHLYPDGKFNIEYEYKKTGWIRANR